MISGRHATDYRFYVDYRRAGEARWSLGKPDDFGVRVPDDLLACLVFFGGKDSEGQLHYRATAFLVSTPTKTSRALYLVTARHNVLKAERDYGNVWIRINTPDGGSFDHEIKATWEFPENPAIDIAAIPFPPLPVAFEASPIPVSWFLTDEAIEERKVGVGEDLVVVGLFRNHVGKSRNLPIVRCGSIASMPQEPLIDDSGEEFLAYLAEVRSIGGLSGSPVFVALNPFVRMGDPDEVGVIDGGDAFSGRDTQVFYLLGLVRGHWRKTMESDYSESGSDRLNTGIAMVTPITELLPLLEETTFVNHRKQIDKQAATESGMVEDWDSGESSEFERFEGLTRKIVGVPKDEVDELRRDKRS